MKHNSMTENRNLALNIVSVLLAFMVNVVIGFFLSPYIVENLGVEAKGFMNLSVNFASYAGIIAIAINSMVGRFVTLEVHKKNMDRANKYYTVATVGNLAISLMMLIPFTLIIIYLEKIINIPEHLVSDVKLLFILILSNFLISTAFFTWSLASFVTNKLYIRSVLGIGAQLISVLLIVLLFGFLRPAVYYLGISTISATIFLAVGSFYYKNKLTPELSLKSKDFELTYLKELVSSGAWFSLVSLGRVLLGGLDLLIANLFIGSKAMGMLALAKMLPDVMTQLTETVTEIFVPTLSIKYAESDLGQVEKELKKGIKITGLIVTLPVAILLVFGRDFYRLWVPSQDAQVLYVISILLCSKLILLGALQVLSNIFRVLNRVKMDSILEIISGLVNLIMVLALLRLTDLGIYAVAGVSSAVSLIRGIFFTVPLATRYMGVKKTTFLPEMLYSVLSILFSIGAGSLLKSGLRVDSWLGLIVAMALMGIIGLIINISIFLNKEEKQYIAGKLKILLRLRKDKS